MDDAAPHSVSTARISVIIPAFNRGATIARTLASIGPGAEVIVVDDGSRDDTAAAARAAGAAAGLDLTVLRQANAGPGAARNRGARLARGDWFAFLDSDDYWLPWTLETCRKAVARHPQAGLVFLQTVDVSEGQQPVLQSAKPVIRVFPGFVQAVEACPGTRFGSCNVMIRRDLFDGLGGFASEIRCSEDTDLFLRAADQPCVVVAGAPLVAHVQGGADRLTGNFPSVAQGLEFLLARAAAYPAPGPLRRRMLAKSVTHTIRTAFGAGRARAAYGLYLRNLPLLLRAGAWHWLIRLPAYPLLHRLRPASYPMRRGMAE